MPPLLTSIGTLKQNLSGSAFEALAAATGDSLSIPDFREGSRGFVEQVISANDAHKMEVAVYSPLFGDNQYGLRLQHQFNPTVSAAGGVSQLLLPDELDIPVYSTDTLNVQVNGTASDNAGVVLQVYYEDRPGAAQRLANWESIVNNIRSVLGIEVTVTPGTTGNYGTSVAINANDDRLHADRDYAVLGMTSDQPITSCGLRGPDTSNFRIACPCHYDERHSANYFIHQDTQRPSPHIPILNSNNKGTTLLDGISAKNVGATKVSVIMAELANKFPG